VLISFAQGFGAGGIDAGLNTYVAANLKQRQMHWMHACYGMGVTTGPFIMTAGLQAFHNWRAGYMAAGLFQLALAALFIFLFPMKADTRVADKGAQEMKLTDYNTPMAKTLALAPAWAGMLMFMLCSGAEASLGFWAYSILTESRGVASGIAGVLAGSYYAMFTISRIFSGIYSKYVNSNIIVLGSIAMAFIGSLLLWMKISPVISLAGIIICGFAIAPIYPSLMLGTRIRVGDSHASNTIGMQASAASIGSACIPALLGVLARRVSVEAITGALAVLFIVILFVFIAVMQIKPRRRQNA
jgi:fucose permease